MNIKNTFLVPAIAFTAMGSTMAAVNLEASLEKVAAKVDTDGTYLQLNKIDGDIDKLIEYAELALDIAKENERSIPKGLKIKNLAEVLGLDEIQAIAASSKKVDGAWNSRFYTWTGGSNKGLLSVYGLANEKFEVADFAPETTDVALQLRLDLSQAKAILTEIADAMGERRNMEREMTKPQPEIGGMTPFQLIEKLNLRASLAIDIDRDVRMPMPGVKVPAVEIVGRLDNVSWAWELFGDQLIKESGLPWQSKKEGDVTTYSLPPEMTKELMGYSPVIRVEKKHVWVASKPTVLDAALGNGKKLRDGAAYKKTMATLPQNGNSLVYLSKDLMTELVYQYNEAQKNGTLNDPDFEVVKPLIDKLLADFTAPDSGIAAVIQQDANGLNTVIRAPFTFKNYLDQLVPYLQMGVMSTGMPMRAF